MGYDSTNGKLVLYGGNVSSTYYPETWTTSDPSDGWELVATDTFVSARKGSAMAWDATNNGLLMFGGYRADNVRLNDMWLWDGADWNAIDSVDKPTPRYNHSMVTDPATGDIYLFGGRDASNVDLNDLWIWDGTNWSEVTDAGTPPNASSGYLYMRAAWDASDSALVVYNSATQRTYKFKNDAWSELAIGTKPSPGSSFIFHYSPETQSCILFGGTSHTGQTWEFRDDEWILLTPAATPNRSYYHAAAYHEGLSELVITLGWMDTSYNGINSPRNYDTWFLKDDNWTFASGRVFQFDMSERESGIWNFTSINVPSGSEVRFGIRNASNTPVVWLATENVQIDGILRLDGSNAQTNNGADNYARGGPGGAPGGLGAIRFDVSGNYAGTPGQGAGGAPGVTASQYGADGEFRNTYGNSLLLPLTGGSGGGGGASSASVNGGHGAGGGGAILIASDKDITVNGYINADGGDRRWSGTSYGGKGSGGWNQAHGGPNKWVRYPLGPRRSISTKTILGEDSTRSVFPPARGQCQASRDCDCADGNTRLYRPARAENIDGRRRERDATTHRKLANARRRFHRRRPGHDRSRGYQCPSGDSGHLAYYEQWRNHKPSCSRGSRRGSCWNTRSSLVYDDRTRRIRNDSGIL